MLITFVRLIRDPTTAEYNIIKRQVVIKDINSKSWTVDIRKLLHKFNLPSCHDLLRNTPKKEAWQYEVKKAVSGYYSVKLKKELEKQSSTRYINPCACSLSKPHNIWSTAGSSKR